MEPYNWSQHEPTILNDVWCWVLATEVKENNHKVMPFKFKINACPMHELQQDLTWRGDDASLISQLLYFAARAWRWFGSAWTCLEVLIYQHKFLGCICLIRQCLKMPTSKCEELYRLQSRENASARNTFLDKATLAKNGTENYQGAQHFLILTNHITKVL